MSDPSDGILYLLGMMENNHFNLFGGCPFNLTCTGYTISKQICKIEITRDPHNEPKTARTGSYALLAELCKNQDQTLRGLVDWWHLNNILWILLVEYVE
jgi:hypothetical protein